MAAPPHVGALFTQFEAPLGAPPNAAAHCGAPLTRLVAPYGTPPTTPVASSTARRRPILVHPSHGSWPHRELHKKLCHNT
eukprot:1643066-Pyramimonas_sp.AAC.1